jgi:hypothetical protein
MAWFDRIPAFSEILTKSQFALITEGLRAAGIAYLIENNEEIYFTRESDAKVKSANELYDLRVNACMYNPAGKASGTVKRWYYCQFPLELRLCNTVVLVSTKKFDNLDLRKNTRIQHLGTCLDTVHGRTTQTFREVLDARFSSYFEKNQTPTRFLNTSSGAELIASLYDRIYLNDAIGIEAGENQEFYEDRKAQNKSAWLKIITSGTTINVNPPIGATPHSLIEHGAYWLKAFAFLRIPGLKASDYLATASVWNPVTNPAGFVGEKTLLEIKDVWEAIEQLKYQLDHATQSEEELESLQEFYGAAI